MRIESPNQISSGPALESRYTYYRRCQQFKKSGEQCKAPAVRSMACGGPEFAGGSLCWKHAEQAATARRREQQRRELLSRPGLGLGDFNSLQRTIAALAQAIIDNQVDHKLAWRMAAEIQAAGKLLRMAPIKNKPQIAQIDADQQQVRIHAKERESSEKQRQFLISWDEAVAKKESGRQQYRENSLMQHGRPQHCRDVSTLPHPLCGLGLAQM